MPAATLLAALRPRTPAVLAVTMAVAVVALWPTSASLSKYWSDIQTYEHGYLIAAVTVVWLIVVLRRAAPAEPRYSSIGLALLAATLILWLVAMTANVNILHQLLLPPAIWLTVCAVAGWRVARRFIAPIGFFYFAIPIWDYSLPILQQLCVAVTEGSLGLVGVPTVVRENTVTIPEGTFVIVEGCSGLRYFMVTLAVAYLATALNPMTRGRVAIFFVASAGLALLANWIRIFIVIYAGHVTNMQHYLVATEHLSLGNGIFVLLLAVVVLLARRWSHAAAPASGLPAAALAGNASASAANHRPWHSLSGWWAALPATALLLASTVVTRAQGSTTPTAALGSLPVAASAWQGPLPAQSSWLPRYGAASAERRASYQSASGAIVELYVNLYAGQSDGHELVGYVNTLVAPAGWSREWPPRAQKLAVTGAPTLMSYVVRHSDGHNWLLAYLYQVGSLRTSSDPLAQFAYGVQAVWRAAPAGVVAITVQCGLNCEAAQQVAAGFWSNMSQSILAMVPDHAGPG
jgi:EpsI family protein